MECLCHRNVICSCNTEKATNNPDKQNHLRETLFFLYDRNGKENTQATRIRMHVVISIGRNKSSSSRL
uniref:Uncharacterized protein n=1 Tax=Arion vulgaris TaxID=1028688 RepID=A0A0B6YPN1_9EUPU